MTKLSNKSLHQRDQAHYLATFKRYPIALSHGKGSRVWDVEGREYLDVLAGIAVNSVGHAHPKLVQAIAAQAEKLIHISNFYLSEAQVALSEKLCQLADLERVFLANSGAEAVEGAIKLARKYAHSQGRGGSIISFTGSFHGRTLATIATGKESMQKGFAPIPCGFKKAVFNDLASVRDIAHEDVAAILVEPIQGEGGIHPANPEFLRGLRQLCDERNIVLIFDEIQCGMGRTGHFFAKDLYGVQPDIMTLAKALGGGVPIGAFLSNEKVGSAIDFGDHGTTFGGNPLACAAALATIQIMEEEGLLDHARQRGAWLREQIEAWRDPRISEVRGEGLMIGVEFRSETAPLAAALLENGVLANATAGKVLRLVPPLNISHEDLVLLVAKIKKSMDQIMPL